LFYSCMSGGVLRPLIWEFFASLSQSVSRGGRRRMAVHNSQPAHCRLLSLTYSPTAVPGLKECAMFHDL